MIKQVIRLVRPGLFLPSFEVEKYHNEQILIQPVWLSICAADQRYFQGNRPLEVLKRKLPMALFHEAVGKVLDDPSEQIKTGSYCVLLPGGIDSQANNSNYKKGAFFRSSNADGFCQEVLYMSKEELIPIPDNNAEIYVFTELMSVCCQAIRRIEEVANIYDGINIGIWGDGAMGYVMALTLSNIYPKSRLYVFGKHDDKLSLFSFVEKQININSIENNISIDIGIECVGGIGSQSAIAQMIDCIKPTGNILLMGVSETPVVVNTRMILEKGLNLIGTSRSTRKDFEKAVDIIHDEYNKNALMKIISCEKDVYSATDMMDIFTHDKSLPFKTIVHIH